MMNQGLAPFGVFCYYQYSDYAVGDGGTGGYRCGGDNVDFGEMAGGPRTTPAFALKYEVMSMCDVNIMATPLSHAQTPPVQAECSKQMVKCTTYTEGLKVVAKIRRSNKYTDYSRHFGFR